MASAKKCDRCGCLYENNNIPDCDIINKEFWKYSIMKEYPYPEEKLDLCLSCWKELYTWLMEGRNG